MRFRGDRVVDGTVTIGGGVDLWPVTEAPTHWRALLDKQASAPLGGFESLPGVLAAGVENTSGTLLARLTEIAIKRWHTFGAEAKAKADVDAAATLADLVRIREALDQMPPTYAQARPAYRQMAALVYGNAFPLDEATGRPVLPGDVQHIDTEGSPFAGCPVSPYLASEGDGIAIGMGLSLVNQPEGTVAADVVTIVGGVGLTAVGLLAAVAVGAWAASLAAYLDTDSTSSTAQPWAPSSTPNFPPMVASGHP